MIDKNNRDFYFEQKSIYQKLKNEKLKYEIQILKKKRPSIYEKYQPLIKIIISVILGCPLAFFYYTTFVHPMLMIKSNEQEIVLQKKEIENLEISRSLEKEKIDNSDMKEDLRKKKILLEINEKKYFDNISKLNGEKIDLEDKATKLEQYQLLLEAEKNELNIKNNGLVSSEKLLLQKQSKLFEINSKINEVFILVSPSIRIIGQIGDTDDNINHICVLLLNRSKNYGSLSSDLLITEKNIIDKCFQDIIAGKYESSLRDNLLQDIYVIQGMVDHIWIHFDPSSKVINDEINQVINLSYDRITKNKNYLIKYANDIANTVNIKTDEINKMFEEYSKY